MSATTQELIDGLMGWASATLNQAHSHLQAQAAERLMEQEAKIEEIEDELLDRVAAASRWDD